MKSKHTLRIEISKSNPTKPFKSADPHTLGLSIGLKQRQWALEKIKIRKCEK